MANLLKFKRIVFLFVLCITMFFAPAFAEDTLTIDEINPIADCEHFPPLPPNEHSVQRDNRDYYKIYEELPEPDFNYIFDMDPYQTEEYRKYMYAPYPLFRTAVPFTFKNTVIPPGYYLLTPREKDGKWYVLFKTNGRVKYIVPVYEKDLVEPAFYKRYVPERKLTLWQNICQKTTNVMGKLFSESTQKTPPPKSYIDVNEIDNDFWQVVLYYGGYKYYLIFMR